MGTNVSGASGPGEASVWYHQLKRAVARWDLTPAQITGIYLLLGYLALYVSDVLLVQLVEDPDTISQLQAVKGGVEVAATAGLIYVLARRSRRALQLTNERLARQQEELQVLHRVLRHNLRHEVNIVQGYGSRLDEVIDSPRGRRWCEQIVAAAGRITHYTEQAGKINRVSPEDATRTIDLATLVPRVVDENQALGAAASVEVSIPDAALVRAHPMLEGALDELVTNAVAHNDHDRPAVGLTVDPTAGPAHRTTLLVSDNGPGIPESVRRTIDQRSETQLLHLEGLGLWFVSWVLTLSDAELVFEDRTPRGADVRIQLPTARPDPPGLSAVSDLTAQAD